MITTVFCYCKGALSRYSKDVRVMKRQLTKGLGFPVVPRDALPCRSNSAVIVFNAYGAVDNDHLASIFSTVSCAFAVAVDGGVPSSSSVSSLSSRSPPFPSQPNTTRDIQLRFAWLHLGPTPITFFILPEYLYLIDHSGTLTTASQCYAPCRALARDGRACWSTTKNKKGLCWRHRPDLCFHSFFRCLIDSFIHSYIKGIISCTGYIMREIGCSIRYHADHFIVRPNMSIAYQ